MTATEAAMYMAEALRSCGVRVVIDNPGKAREVYDRTVSKDSGDAKFSVGDMMKLNYIWNGEEVSLKTFAMAFSDLIKVKDRTLEDADRIAKAFLDAVKQNPEAFVPKLKAENMSHARYFILNDGSVFSKTHPMYNSPEYQTQRGLAAIYEDVLGEDGFSRFLGLLDPSRVRTPEENDEFLAMERKVSGSDTMQCSLEVNADAVNESRVKGIRNLVQYFENNPDYTYPEKAVIVKGASQWGVVEKKQGDANEVRVVRMTDSNDLAVPVIGGEAAAVVEGLRKGMNFKDALKNGRELLAQNGQRSVPGTYTGWKVYRKSNREKDAAVLQNDAAGTGWCTGGSIGTARSHLSRGDFHIYFESGEPLIAIRTEDGMMAEPPRGAHEGQFCTDREEQIAFEYIRQGNGIIAGDDYVSDIEDIRRIMSPEATWKDAFQMPEHRRYENGEFGGDTSAWGKAVEERIKSLLASSVDERHREGYYLAKELKQGNPLRKDIPSDVLYVKGDCRICVDDLRNIRSFMGRLSILEGVDVRANALQSIEGGLHIRKGATLRADALQEVEDHLEVQEGATLQVNALQKIRGGLSVNQEATVQADALQRVRNNLIVYKGAILQADALQSVGSDLIIGEGATLQADILQRVGGSLVVHNGATLQAHVLQEVGRSLSVYKESIIQADAIQRVGCDLYVFGEATLQADALQSVGRGVTVWAGAQLDAPALQGVDGYMNIREGARLNAPLLGYRDSVSFSMSDGTIYGYAKDGVIHLTPEGINPNTPIHEYAHLWLAAYRQNKSEDWNRLVSKIEESGLTRLVEDNPMYSYLKGNREALAEEAICQMAGNNGERLLLALYQDGDKAHQLADRFRRFVNSYAVKEVFHAAGLKDDILNVNVNILRGYTEGIGRVQSVSAKNECETNSSVLHRFDLTRIKSGPKLS